MNLEQLILENYDKLSPTDWEIWDYIWENREKCEQLSITQIAEGANVSPGAITRLMKKLGLGGFTEFKLTLRWQNRGKSYLPLGLQSRLMHGFTETMKTLNDKDFSDMFEIFDHAEHVFVYGTGEVQRNAAEEFKRMYMLSGKQPVFVIESLQEFEHLQNVIRPNDALVVISMGGERKEANEAIQNFKDQGVKIISVTNGDENTLAQMSDFNLPFSCHYIIKRPGNLADHHTSSIFFFVIESMFLEYLQYLHATDLF